MVHSGEGGLSLEYFYILILRLCTNLKLEIYTGTGRKVCGGGGGWWWWLKVILVFYFGPKLILWNEDLDLDQAEQNLS